MSDLLRKIPVQFRAAAIQCFLDLQYFHNLCKKLVCRSYKQKRFLMQLFHYILLKFLSWFEQFFYLQYMQYNSAHCCTLQKLMSDLLKKDFCIAKLQFNAVQIYSIFIVYKNISTPVMQTENIFNIVVLFTQLKFLLYFKQFGTAFCLCSIRNITLLAYYTLQ